MKPRILLAALAVLATIAVAAPSAMGAKSLFKPCSGSFDPQGNPGGGFYRNITAKRTTCTTARYITRAWVVAHKSGSTNPTKKSIVKGYSCTGTAPKKNVLQITCSIQNGFHAVRFEGSP